MNILVFGGNRFVGKQLIEELLEQGYNVDMFNRSGTGPDYVMETCEGNIIQGDRNNREDIEKIDFSKYDTIVDMCLFFPGQFEKMKDLIPTNTNYIFVSSGAADDRYVRNFGDYGYDKRAVESMLVSSDLNYKIVRPSYIVGQGNHRPRLGYYMNKIINQEHIPVAGNAQNKINIVFVQDVVDCLVELVYDKVNKQCRCETCVSNNRIDIVGENIEVIDLINEVSKYCREGQVMLVQDDEEALFSKNEFEFDSHIEYTKLEKGLKEYAKWFYNEGAKKYGYTI